MMYQTLDVDQEMNRFSPSAINIEINNDKLRREITHQSTGAIEGTALQSIAEEPDNVHLLLKEYENMSEYAKY